MPLTLLTSDGPSDKGERRHRGHNRTRATLKFEGRKRQNRQAGNKTVRRLTGRG
jgi:hypothetical protein